MKENKKDVKIPWRYTEEDFREYGTNREEINDIINRKLNRNKGKAQ